MSLGILGRKKGMTQVFRDDGRIIPVTVVEAGPCTVLQVKTKAKDGYEAVQLGFCDKREKLMRKPELGKFKKINVTPKRFIREIRTAADQKFEVGQELKVDIFAAGDAVDVTGTSIGKGFQGGVKRWHWHGGPMTHGSMSHRRIGSISSSSDPSRVFKGHHLPGHMGMDRVTVKNLKVIKIDAENNLMLVKGAVPGHRDGLLTINLSRKKKKITPESKPEAKKEAEHKAKKESKPEAKKEAKK